MTSKETDANGIRIGVVADEPIRVAGLASIFEQPPQNGQPQLIPIIASYAELMCRDDIEYVVVDLNCLCVKNSFAVLQSIHKLRPDLRLIVIGPEGDDQLVIEAIIGGARAYIGQRAGPEVARQAIEVVTAGSIWAPRQLLCKTIDQLLKSSRMSQSTAQTQLTSREQQVLELLMAAHSTREIAKQLGIEQRTVKAHIARLMHKTGSDNRIRLSLSMLNRSPHPTRSNSSEWN